jgi:hypothetical protein
MHPPRCNDSRSRRIRSARIATHFPRRIATRIRHITPSPRLTLGPDRSSLRRPIRHPRPHVLLGRHIQIRLHPALMLLVQVLQKRHAPLTPRPRPQAITDQRSNGRTLPLQIPADLPQGNVKAQTHFIIRVHAQMVGTRRARCSGLGSRVCRLATADCRLASWVSDSGSGSASGFEGLRV